MENRFPRAVTWDKSKQHHVAVLVDWGDDKVAIACMDCQDAYSSPLRNLQLIKNSLAGDETTQVVGWVERDA